MSSKKFKLDSVGLGKALFVTNLFFGVALVAMTSFTGLDMKSVGWNAMLAFPVILAVCGFVYGAIGAGVYNMLSKEVGHNIVESE